MTTTEIAAWWGAIVATLVLLWDGYKWILQGPRLSMRVAPNMLIIGDPEREGKKWISVTVTNIGDRPTTMKGVGMEYYISWYQRFRKIPKTAAVFPNPNTNFPLPRIINPGEEWIGFIPQERADKDIDLYQMANNGHLLIWLSRSDTQKSIKKRVIIRETKNDS